MCTSARTNMISCSEIVINFHLSSKYVINISAAEYSHDKWNNKSWFNVHKSNAWTPVTIFLIEQFVRKEWRSNGFSLQDKKRGREMLNFITCFSIPNSMFFWFVIITTTIRPFGPKIFFKCLSLLRLQNFRSKHFIHFAEDIRLKQKFVVSVNWFQRY